MDFIQLQASSGLAWHARWIVIPSILIILALVPGIWRYDLDAAFRSRTVWRIWLACLPLSLFSYAGGCSHVAQRHAFTYKSSFYRSPFCCDRTLACPAFRVYFRGNHDRRPLSNASLVV